MNELRNWYKLNKAKINVSDIKRSLVVTPKTYNDEPPVHMNIFREDENYLYVPYYFGQINFGDVVDKRVEGSSAIYNKRPNPYHHLAPEGQAEFIRDILVACDTHNCFTISAGVGCGKTISILSVIATRGCEALVIVPTDSLMTQWVNQIKDKLGLTDDQIGIVKQDKCDYIGKHITVASMQSIECHKYEDGFYKYHGFVCFDEGDRFAAQKMSNVFGKFHAKIQIPMSATIKRRDGRSEVLNLWYGEPAVTATKMKSSPLIVTPYEYRHGDKPFINDRNQCIAYLGRHKDRNNRLANMIATVKNKGRVVLGIGDSTKQLQYIYKRLVEHHGIPEKEVCIFADQLFTGEKRVSIKGLGLSLFNKIAVTLTNNTFFDNNTKYTFSTNISENQILLEMGEPSSIEYTHDRMAEITGLHITIIKKIEALSVEGGNSLLLQITPEILNSLISDNIKLCKQEIETEFQKGEVVLRPTMKSISISGTGLKNSYIKKKVIELISATLGIDISLINDCSTLSDQKRKTPKAEIQSMLTDENMKIYLATYGVMKMGVDVPWLDFGIDLTPRVEGTQVAGRIRRRYKGKGIARWFTILDTGLSNIISNINKARLKDYAKSDNVTITETRK